MMSSSIKKNETFSIIIPTMLKDESILSKLLDELVNDSVVGEIIIIDNSLKGFSYASDKVRVIIPKENLFVNPSWNLGILECKSEYFGILNDDLLLPKNLCVETLKFLQQNDGTGLIGLNPGCVKACSLADFETYPKSKSITFTPFLSEVHMGFWGSAFFGRKKNYYVIPEDIKIWCGDNYLLKMNEDSGYQNYKICGVTIKHYGSLTSSSTALESIKRSDIDKYMLIDERFRVISNNYVRYRFFERIFSLKYNRAKTHKIVTILGFKIKIRKKGR